MMKARKTPKEKTASWQTVYCSFIMLVVSFFVMLCSFATQERGKLQEIQRSFKDALSEFSLGILFTRGEGIMIPTSDIDSAMHGKIAAPIQKLLKGKGLENEVFLKSTKMFVNITFLDKALFENGTATLSAKGKDIIRDFARGLGTVTLPVRIEGHTDNQNVPEGSYASNWHLSAMKAIAVMNYLKDDCGISQKMLTANGFSEYRPFVPNTTDEERKRNRRIEIIIPVAQEFFTKKGGITKETPPSFRIWDLNN